MKKYRALIQLPVVMIVEILSRLPFKTLHKFKCVSKSWHSLITHQVFPKILQAQFIGFFYNTNSHHHNGIFSYVEDSNNNNNNNGRNIVIDPTLSFLPLGSELTVFDSCSGLVLCAKKQGVATHCYVCNPVTKSFVQHSWTFAYHNFVFLDFDPRVSPHYRVILTSACEGYVRINVYDSEASRWKKTRFVTNCRICKFSTLGGNHCCALWNGDVYFDAPWGSRLKEPAGSIQKDWETVRIGPLDAGVVGLEFIKFPIGTQKPPHERTYIGRIGDKLCFAGLDGNQLRVWTLPGREHNAWVMEHNIITFSLSGRCDPRGGLCPRIVGFHPFQNAILILFKCVIFTYDLKKRSSDEICRIGAEAEENGFSLVFPFSSLSFDLLENRKSKGLIPPRDKELSPLSSNVTINAKIDEQLWIPVDKVFHLQ